MDQRTVEANGLSFGILETGPSDGPLALCLHGFPDTAHTWRHLLPSLAEAGYHAVAPFMRGYAPTDVPDDGAYQTGALSRDVSCLHEALGGDERAVLIGHDWGALAGYAAAAHRPGRWRRLVTAAVPPPQSVMGSFFSYDQLHRSWYTFFFQSPLAELAVPLEDYDFIARLWSDWSPGYDGSGDVAMVRQAIGTPERTLAAISYYRALYDGSLHDDALAEEQAAAVQPVPVPTLYLHGRDDGCMALDIINDPLTHLGEGSAMGVVEGAGHFLHLERPDEVGALVLQFLSL